MVGFKELSGSALAIAFLGLLEALAIAKSISTYTRQRLDYNRQCMAEGLANLTGGFFQCLPGSGSLTRSVHQLSVRRSEPVLWRDRVGDGGHRGSPVRTFGAIRSQGRFGRPAAGDRIQTDRLETNELRGCARPSPMLG